MSSAFGPVIIADKLAKFPVDIVELNPVNKLEYELMIVSLPAKFVRSFSTKFVTAPPAPPPPPPQAVKVVAIAPAINNLRNFFIVR